MIMIDEKYYIDADDKNYILQEKSIVKDEKSKNYGKETFKILGYFGKLDNVLKYLIDLNIKEYVSKNRTNTLEQLIKKINSIEKSMEKKFNMSKSS